MNQKLVTKKNKKVRLLKERYPHVNVKIFYQRDYLHLLVKYGLEEEQEAAAPAVAPTRLPGPPQIIRVDDAEEGARAG